MVRSTTKPRPASGGKAVHHITSVDQFRSGLAVTRVANIPDASHEGIRYHQSEFRLGSGLRSVGSLLGKQATETDLSTIGDRGNLTFEKAWCKNIWH